MKKDDSLGTISSEDADALYSEALNIIKVEGKASTSFLQRKLTNWIQ